MRTASLTRLVLTTVIMISLSCKSKEAVVDDDDSQGDRLRKIYAVFDSAYNMIYGPKKVHGTVDWSDDDSLLLEILPRVLHREDPGNPTKNKIINIREINKR